MRQPCNSRGPLPGEPNTSNSGSNISPASPSTPTPASHPTATPRPYITPNTSVGNGPVVVPAQPVAGSTAPTPTSYGEKATNALRSVANGIGSAVGPVGHGIASTASSTVQYGMDMAGAGVKVIESVAPGHTQRRLGRLSQANTQAQQKVEQLEQAGVSYQKALTNIHLLLEHPRVPPLQPTADEVIQADTNLMQARREQGQLLETLQGMQQNYAQLEQQMQEAQQRIGSMSINTPELGAATEQLGELIPRRVQAREQWQDVENNLDQAESQITTPTNALREAQERYNSVREHYNTLEETGQQILDNLEQNRALHNQAAAKAGEAKAAYDQALAAANQAAAAPSIISTAVGAAKNYIPNRQALNEFRAFLGLGGPAAQTDSTRDLDVVDAAGEANIVDAGDESGRRALINGPEERGPGTPAPRRRRADSGIQPPTGGVQPPADGVAALGEVLLAGIDGRWSPSSPCSPSASCSPCRGIVSGDRWR